MASITDGEQKVFEDYILAAALKWLGDYAELPACHRYITSADIEHMGQALHSAADRLPLVWDCHTKGAPMIHVDFTD